MKTPPGLYIFQSDKGVFRKKKKDDYLITGGEGGTIYTKNNPPIHHHILLTSLFRSTQGACLENKKASSKLLYINCKSHRY